MTLIKNKHHLLVVNRKVSFPFHQVIQLLNGGNDDFVIVFIQIAFQTRGVVRAIDAVGGEALILLHGLEIEVFTVDHKEDFINEVQFSRQTCSLKAGQGFA